MHDTATLVLAIISIVIVYTTTVVSLFLWLTSKFRSVETLIFKELGKHAKYDDDRFAAQHDRLMILELSATGVTKSDRSGQQPSTVGLVSPDRSPR